MKRIIQYGLIILALTLFLVSGVILIIVSFDTNTLKPAIYHWVNGNMDRSFKIAGDLEIAFYSSQVEIRANNMTLSEFQNDDQFASIEQTQLSLSLWPLLRRQVIVDHMQIKGLNAKLIRYQDGRMNVDDLLKEDAEPLTFSFDIAKTEIVASHVDIQDEMTAQTLVLDNINLTAGRITADRIEQANFKSQLIRTGIENIGTDKNAHQMSLDIQFDAKRILFNDQERVIGPIALSIQSAESGNLLDTAISISGLHQSGDHIASPYIHVELDARQKEHALQVALETSLSARLNDQQWSFPDFKTSVAFSYPENEKPILGRVAGNINLDLVSELLHAELKGVLADSNLNVDVYLRNFSERNLLFNIQLDQLDLDSLFLSQRSESKKDPVEKKNELTANEMTLPDFSILEHLNLNGTIRIGQLFTGNTRTSGIQLSIEPGQQHFDLKMPVH